jgi:integrase/recombinase XerD
LRKLFDNIDSYRNRLLITVGAETGLRNSDLREIQLSDVDYEELLIHVPDPKGSKAYDVPISEELGFELKQWLKHHRGAYASAGVSNYLFPSEYGPKLETNGGLNTIIKEAATRAGIQEVIATSQISPEQRVSLGTEKETRNMHRVTVHTLRHTFLTLLKDAEVPLVYRQLVANHRDPNTTLGYEHGSNDIFEIIRDRFEPAR